MEVRHSGDAISRPMKASESPGAAREVRHGLLMGALCGLAAITCCVSPVVLVLLGVATAAQAVTLGDTLYYEYGWWFRGAGAFIGGVAIYLYLRRRQSCSVQGVRRFRGMLAAFAVAAGATYAGLFWFTKMLAVWFA